MTYNIRHGNPPSGKDGMIDLTQCARVIIGEHADLVALQEVDVNTQRTGRNLNEIEELARLTGLKYFFFSKSMDYQGGEYGNALLSRFPIKDTFRYELPLGTSEEQRSIGIIRVELPASKYPLYFASTHLEISDESVRLLQVKKILEITSVYSQQQFILAGDMNSLPLSETIRKLQEGFTLSCNINKCQPTFSSDKPTQTIDYIMINNRTKSLYNIISYTTKSNVYASDHFPVITVLKGSFVNFQLFTF
ncbi:unnamed protein product [Didymodactylos carnosus]|uniref:Endonuclease/exonuclease/phosphatase domain-containing protein n=1 Tax=Didymodactylos carnosus TaxID=1234261 RepID=A0A814AZW6_9BILA|nr:unnamed protein product [Didymodactylos carnosus]CAF0922278.1 unnamed protein product [Didymodactylos carnosus]CAF3592281.1 unnamed protein product [Didymodactylos carnosus]CAF3701416.1 unnamed protein product [Didymodactylos carnosus]